MRLVYNRWVKTMQKKLFIATDSVHDLALEFVISLSNNAVFLFLEGRRQIQHGT